MIVRATLPSGIRLVTEAMPHVRSVTIGAWLTRGSRHESDADAGIAHFIEHMLFKGTTTRSAEDIAQRIDSIGGQLDAFTSKEYAGYYIKVLDEHVPIAVDLLADMLLRPAFRDDDIVREKRVILEELKMVEDTPDDLVHDLFTERYWHAHPLGRPILGTKTTIESFSVDRLRSYFERAYVAPNLVVAAAGNLTHTHVEALVQAAFASVGRTGEPRNESVPACSPTFHCREKDLEQSHVVLGTEAYPQSHRDRFAAFILNTVLGGSISSRLFQNIREQRGLAYAVFSSLSAFRDTGLLTVYAGCANESVDEVVDLVVAELRTIAHTPLSADELRRAKDHLKGNLMLSLESTSSRMTHLARQEIYAEQYESLDDTLHAIEAVSVDDVQRVARDVFLKDALAATIIGGRACEVSATRLQLA